LSAFTRGAGDFSLFLLFLGQPYPIFGQGRQIFPIVYISHPTLPKDRKKPLGQHNFFLQLQIQFLFVPPQRYYIGPPSSKILELHSCF
jgi:hypothetical protein